MSGAPRTKRGRYRTSLVDATGGRSEAEAEEHLRMFEREKRQLLRDSPMKKGSRKTILAESLAGMRVQARYLRELQAVGRLSSEEGRTLPGLYAQIRRCCDDLGLPDAPEGDDKPKSLSDEELLA